MSWIKWHVGTVNDPKFQVIARRANLNIRDIFYIWAAVLEYAGQATRSGTLIGWDSNRAAAGTGLSADQVRMAIFAMQGRLLDGVFVIDWKHFRAPIDSIWHDRLGLTPAEWAEIRGRIFHRDNFTCRYCGTFGGFLECDHVIPLSIGGSSDDANLVTSCRSCNRSKKDRTLSEWRVN
jgi:hypothetical protein